MLRNGLASPRKVFRADIQALRALAVVSVVVFHLKPTWLSGGYVGVDVFFVISGFLITSHLIREYEISGRIRLRAFYLRRVRRLLPASLTVLAFSAAAIAAWLPSSAIQQNAREIIASTLYVENWSLANDAVNYLKAENVPSLVQHFWTLSVEEQFYVVWPLLMLATIWWVARKPTVRLASVWKVVFGAVVVISFAYSITVTATQPSAAYFVTPARAWEFALGGLIAAFSSTLMVGFLAHMRVRVAISWIGVAAIVAAAVAFNAQTPFPGSAAMLPVVGTALVILADVHESRWSPMVVGRLGWVQYVGGISYSVYLWHWPLIILFPYVVGHEPRGVQLVGLIAVIFGAAALSKRFVEDPFLSGRGPLRRNSVLVGAVALCMVGLVSVSSVQMGATQRAVDAAEQHRQEREAGSCFGAQALNELECALPFIPSSPVDAAFAATDYADTTLDDCGRGRTVGPVGDSRECSFGDDSSPHTVLVIGDSHAGQWLPALQAIGAKRDWHIVSLLRSSCPFTEVTPSERGVFQQGCEDWKRLILERVSQLSPDLMFVMSLSPYGYEVADFDPGSPSEMEQGYVENLRALMASGSVVVIRDTPYMGVNIPDCLGGLRSQPSECSQSRTAARDSHPDPLWNAAGEVPGVATIDLTSSFCDIDTCFPVIGNVVVYRDRHHLSASYARSLAPTLLGKLESLGLVVK